MISKIRIFITSALIAVCVGVLGGLDGAQIFNGKGLEAHPAEKGGR